MQHGLLKTALATFLLGSSTLIAGGYKTGGAALPHFPQKYIYSCSGATAQMWIYYLTGDIIPQREILRKFAGDKKGMNTTEYRRAMKHYTGKGFQTRYFGPDIYKAKRRIYKELIKQGRPLEISGTTLKGNNRSYTSKPGMHSLIIWQARIKGKKGHYYLDWVRLHDPVYKSKWEGRYATVPWWRKVPYHELFYKRWQVNSGFPNRFATDD